MIDEAKIRIMGLKARKLELMDECDEITAAITALENGETPPAKPRKVKDPNAPKRHRRTKAEMLAAQAQ